MKVLTNTLYFRLLLFLFCISFFVSEGISQKRIIPRKRKQAVTKSISPSLERVFQSGEVYVHVRSVADRTIRLGLAPGGVTIVEFPKDDFIYARHPGDENIVTIDEMIKTRGNPSDPLIFRPGQGFYVPNVKGKQIPYSQITVQMTSGAVFTFQIYPVKDLQKSATRVEVLYSVTDIIAERNKLNLPTNLNIPREINQTEDEKDNKNGAASIPSDNLVKTENKDLIGENKTENEVLPKDTPEERISAFTKKVVAEAAGYNWKFGTSVHGVALAAQKTLLLENAKYRLDLIAVKNTLNEPIRLVNLPSLVIETFEKEQRKGNALNQEPFPVFSITHNLPEDQLIQPNSVYYFAIVANYPVILGVNQDLKVSVAQTNAADSPAYLNLLTTAR
ncbi:MAG TPA: hypothetical protein PKY82_02340 [Pyrinomonadaceae bacterium]|nr:hypothetical protein [Pyrinomonadaceae bacterium]